MSLRTAKLQQETSGAAYNVMDGGDAGAPVAPPGAKMFDNLRAALAPPMPGVGLGLVGDFDPISHQSLHTKIHNLSMEKSSLQVRNNVLEAQVQVNRRNAEQNAERLRAMAATQLERAEDLERENASLRDELQALRGNKPRDELQALRGNKPRDELQALRGNKTEIGGGGGATTGGFFV